MPKSIFVPHMFDPNYFSAAGFFVNLDSETPSDFVYTGEDTPEAFSAIQSFGARHNVPTPNYDLCNKQKAHAKFAAAGFTVLDTIAVKTRADLENFPHNFIILKPDISYDTSSRGHTLDAAMYCARPKSRLLAQLDKLGAFSGTIHVDEPFIAQQVADGDGDNYKALILSGVVNGQGEVWHCPSLELNTFFKNKVRKVKSVWSEENNTAEVLALQRCVDTLLSAENAKNCFYHLQFLRANESWAPHDFQFRMTYYTNEYLGVGLHFGGELYADYKNALVKFAYDAATEKLVLPTTFGLNFPNVAPFNRGLDKKFITGASKAEVLSILETM